MAKPIFWYILLWLPLFLVRCQLPPLPSERAATPPSLSTPDAPADRPRDLLDVVRERGYLKVGVRVWPDSQFKPPLYRAPLGFLDGYEVDLAWALAEGLGVELEMAESDPRLLARGGWGGEWDIALAWLPITDNAQQTLIFSSPYAYDAAGILIHQDDETISSFGDLAGRRVGVPAFTVYEQLLSGGAPSVEGHFIREAIPPDIQVMAYLRDGDAIRALSEGASLKLDAVLHSRWVLQTAAVEYDTLVLLPEPAFWTPVGIAFDRQGMSSERLRQTIERVLADLREDGTLSDLAYQRYNRDISRLP